MNKRIIKICLIVLSLVSSMPEASADSDPFPGVASGAEIPGTRVSSPPGMSESDFYASSAYQAHTCPAGAGKGGGVDLAFTSDRSKHVRFVYCVKTWRSTETIDAEAKYRSDLAAAQASALAQSQAWNSANPGQQKCFQWGPITSPSGGSSSGGVCANIVGTAPSTPTSTSPSETVTASTTSTTGATSSSPSGSTTASTETKTASTASDPLPNVLNGAEIPGTRVSSAPGVSEAEFYASSAYQSHTCPTGSGRGVGVDLAFTTDRSKHVRYVYCIKNWSASSSSSTTTASETKTDTSTAATNNTDTKTAAAVVVDPIPGVNNRSEIPGSRITSSPGISQSQWEATATYKSFICPTGSEKAMGVDMNFTTTRSDDTWFAYCVKTWIAATNQTTSSSDTNTAATKTSTTLTDTRTVTTKSETTTASTSQALNGIVQIPMASSVAQTLQSLTATLAEAQLVVKTVSKIQSQIKVNTEFANSLLNVTAIKKGAKPINLTVQTNANGDSTLSLKTNLSGYTVTLNAGTAKLDTDKVK